MEATDNKRYSTFGRGVTPSFSPTFTSSDEGTENSSLSSRITTWSRLPRATRIPRLSSHSNNNFGNRHQPKRTGTSFQASLRPYRDVDRHTSNNHNKSDADSSIATHKSFLLMATEENCCLYTCGRVSAALTPSTSTRRMLISILLSTLFCVFVTLQGPFQAELDRQRLEAKAAHAHVLFSPLVATSSSKSGNDVVRTPTMENPVHGAYEFSNNNDNEPMPQPTQYSTTSKSGMSTLGVNVRGGNTLGGSTSRHSKSFQLLTPLEENETETNNLDSSTTTELTSQESASGGNSLSSTIHPNNNNNNVVVAYVLPIFSCYPRHTNGITDDEPVNDDQFYDAAFMIQASIHDHSVRNPRSQSSFDYQMVAIIHRSVQTCVMGRNRTELLLDLGYQVHVVREPIHAVDIRDIHLKRHAPRNNGPQVGMKEMIRLYAFTLTEYPIVTLIDYLTWIVNPPDGLYDILLRGPRDHPYLQQHPDHAVLETFYPNGTIVAMTELPQDIDVIFARNYAALGKDTWSANINLSFLPLRPSKQLFQMLIDTYQSTMYDETWGWASKGYSRFPGSMTTLGLLTYFYNEIRPDHRLEVDHCVYNNMASVPYIAVQSGHKNQCRDVKLHHPRQPLSSSLLQVPGSNDTSIMTTAVTCPDCRLKPWNEVIVANFAICLPPWTCHYMEDGTTSSSSSKVPDLVLPTLQFCRQVTQDWFRLRQAVEDETTLLVSTTNSNKNHKNKNMKTSSATAKGTFHPEIFHGYCQPGGVMGGSYVPMKKIKLSSWS